MLPSNRQGDSLNRGEDHLGSRMCHAVPSCGEMSHHPAALGGRQKAEVSCAVPRWFTMSHYDVEKLGQAELHLPVECLQAGVV